MYRLLIIALLFNSLHATFYERGLEGRYYYEEKTADAPTQEKVTQENALEILQQFQKEFETSKALAVMDPTYENIQNFLLLQKKVVESSEKFSAIWTRILLDNSFLSDQFTNPTASFAVNERKRFEEKKIEVLLEKLKKDHRLLFVFDTANPFARIAARIAKEFEEESGWEVIGVSLDGNALPEFPSPRIAADGGAALGITESPTFLVIHPEKDFSVPVGFGAISLSQLRENIFKQLASKEDP